MTLSVEPAPYDQLIELQAEYRAEANCQLIHDSHLRRGIADGYLFRENSVPVGFAGIYNRYDPGHINAFYLRPEARRHARAFFTQFIEASSATHIAAQTNVPWLLLMLYEFAVEIRAENYLFGDGPATQLPPPNGAIFRKRQEGDQSPDPESGFVLEVDGRIVADGGYLTHYNPPFVDLYMQTVESERQKGYSSYLIQELRRVCREEGRIPAARCNGDNVASRRTLEKGGLLNCGRLLVGKLADKEDPIAATTFV
ncbi:MAG: hypothetical protein QM758_14175 [Armatimonas sp.]